MGFFGGFMNKTSCKICEKQHYSACKNYFKDLINKRLKQKQKRGHKMVAEYEDLSLTSSQHQSGNKH